MRDGIFYVAYFQKTLDISEELRRASLHLQGNFSKRLGASFHLQGTSSERQGISLKRSSTPYNNKGELARFLPDYPITETDKLYKSVKQRAISVKVVYV